MKKSLKSILALLLALVMVMALVACSPKAGPDTSAPGNSPSASNPSSGGEGTPSADPAKTELSVAVFLDSGTLDPLGMTGAGGFLNVQRTYMESMWDFDSDGNMVYYLATEFERLDPLHYVLHLRDDVTFSNGKPMTAEDVWYSMEICRDDPQFYLNVAQVDFEKSTIVDDYTIDIVATQFNPSMDSSFSQLVIVDKDAYSPEAYATHPIGTGAYMVTDYVVNSHVTVEARDDYWGEAPAIKTIYFKCLNEASQRINALDTGDVDYASIPLKDIDYIESLGNYDINTVSTGMCYVTMFNMSPDSPLATFEARAAVASAIDRQAISNVVFSGHAQVLDWALCNTYVDFKDSFITDNELYTDGYNIERAKQYAEEAGIVGTTFRLITNGSADYITMAEIIQNGLREAGMDAKILNYDQATYFGLLMDESNFDIGIFTPTSPSQTINSILKNYLEFVPLGWTGPEHDEYMSNATDACEIVDETERAAATAVAVQTFEKYMPWYGLTDGPTATAYSSDLQNVAFMLSGAVYFKDFYFG